MGGSSKKTTVGYKYYVGEHMVICQGPVDYIRGIRVDKKKVFSGQQAEGRLSINKPNLFGGEEREGGIKGKVDFAFGGSTQQQNPYLVNRLGSQVPAFRGVLSAILNRVYRGVNPYLKTWDFRVQRVHTRQDGIAQWYDEKSEISRIELFAYDNVWKYRVDDVEKAIGQPYEYTQPNYDDSGWLIGQGGFGNVSLGGIANNTFVPSGLIGRGIWTRREFTLTNEQAAGDLLIDIWRDDASWAWINGVEVFENQESDYFHGSYVIDSSLIRASNVLVVQVLDSIPGGTPTEIFSGMRISMNNGQYDMNPAHIIRECITDPDWGMGYLDSDVDNTSFTIAADTLWAESMGISLLWDKQIEIQEFITEILRHIDAALYVDRKTGKFVLKLIRSDYDESNLIVVDETIIQKVVSYTRPSQNELVNSLTVVYEEPYSGNNATATADDPSLVAAYGGVNSTTIQYPGFSNFDIASKAATRDLKALSSPLLTSTIRTTRAVSHLNVGDTFKFAWSDYHDDYIIMRVKQIAFGDGNSNVVEIQCVEDVFSTPETSLTISEFNEWTDPIALPTNIDYIINNEATYYELVFSEGQASVDSELLIDPSIGYINVSSAHVTEGSFINGKLWVNSGGSYIVVDQVDFCPAGLISIPYDKSDTTLTFSEIDNIEDIVVGTHGILNGEIMAIIAIDDVLLTIDVHRGCIDTLPGLGSVGDEFLIYSDYSVSDEIQYVDSEVINVKVPSMTGEGTQDISSALAYPVTMNSRAIRPYPPGNLKINGLVFPAQIQDSIDITWSHRDRITQTTDHFAYTTGNVGPEAGTTYDVTVKYSDGSVLESASGLTSDNFSVTNPIETIFDTLIIEIQTFRDGFESTNKYLFTILYIDSSTYTPTKSFTITDESYTPSIDFTF